MSLQHLADQLVPGRLNLSFVIHLVAILFIGGCATQPQVESAPPEPHVEIIETSVSREAFLRDLLKKNKLRHPSIQNQIERVTSDPKLAYEKTISLNVLGFLSKADYSVHFSEKAIKQSRKFLSENSRTLAYAEKKYQVPKEVIAALLWVETQHGKITGKTPIVQSYLGLALARYPSIQKSLIQDALQRRSQEKWIREKYPSTLELEKKVVERTQIKSDWALEQLKSIQTLSYRGNSKILKYLGSFAGAFGVSQFIPSTYAELAVSRVKDKTPNLYHMPDAILSVANFLKSKGWDNRQRDSQFAALFEYNRIRDYGEVILKLADALRAP